MQSEGYTVGEDRDDDPRSPRGVAVKSNDKKRARLNAVRAFLSKVEYDDKDHDVWVGPTR